MIRWSFRTARPSGGSLRFPLEIDEITDVPGGVERPSGDKRAVYHTCNPLSLEQDVKRGHEGQGPQEHKEREFHGLSLEARQIVESMDGCAEDR